MHKLKTFFSITIIVVLLCLGAYSFYTPNQVSISEIEKRILQTNDELIEDFFLSSNFTKTFESIIADQFINRYYFVKLRNTVNYRFIETILGNNDNPFLLKRIGDSPIFKIGKTDYLMSFPILYNKDVEKRMIRRTEQINKLARDFPDIKFYVYKPTQIFETDFFDQANKIQSAGKIYDQLLRDHLEVPYDSFEFHTFSDYPKYQYFTDHHWNHDGADRGYNEIINLMLGEHEERLVPQDINCFGNLTFKGTYSSLSGFVTPGAPFCAYRYNLPEYELYVNGAFESLHRDTNNYFHTVVENRDSYHYSAAFDLGSGFVEIKSSSINDRNLLIIGDSYAPSIAPLLAYHYDQIYLVNPIRFQQVYGYDFIYDDFLIDNKIENVLFMYVIENYYAADEWGERYKVFDVHRKEDE